VLLLEYSQKGLGKAQLSVPKNASHKELSTVLENHFPNLKVARGLNFSGPMEEEVDRDNCL